MSEDLTGTAQLQSFVRNAPWTSLSSTDGPTTDGGSQFTTEIDGFQFNFAAQTAVAPPTTFESAATPADDQVAEVNDVAKAVLDRMYTFAVGTFTPSTIYC